MRASYQALRRSLGRVGSSQLSFCTTKVWWSDEWEALKLGARKAPAGTTLNKLLFVECGAF
jgi:hypothetical protein